MCRWCYLPVSNAILTAFVCVFEGLSSALNTHTHERFKRSLSYIRYTGEIGSFVLRYSILFFFSFFLRRSWRFSHFSVSYHWFSECLTFVDVSWMVRFVRFKSRIHLAKLQIKFQFCCCFCYNYCCLTNYYYRRAKYCSVLLALASHSFSFDRS